MKLRILMLTALVVTLGGCATMGGAHALATPWGVGGMYSLKDKAAPVREPSLRSVDAQVAQALDRYELRQSPNEDVRVANR